MSVLARLAQTSSEFNFEEFESSFDSSQFQTTTLDASETAAAAGIAAGMLIFTLFVGLIAYVFFAICMMKIFKKAGRKDAWAAWIPIYNSWVFFEVAGRPGWWALLSFIPVVGLVLGVIGILDLVKKFGKGAGYALLLIFVPIIGMPMLAFGDSQYEGVSAGPANPPQQPQTTPTPPAQPPQQPPVVM